MSFLNSLLDLFWIEISTTTDEISITNIQEFVKLHIKASFVLTNMNEQCVFYSIY